MGRGTNEFDTAFKSTMVGSSTGKGGEEGVMNVDDTIGK